MSQENSFEKHLNFKRRFHSTTKTTNNIVLSLPLDFTEFSRNQQNLKFE